MKYAIKKKVNKGLKAVHNFILKFGINVSFVRKEDTISAIQHNSLNNTDKLYVSKEYLYDVNSREHQKFFAELIKLLKDHHIDLNNKEVADVGCGIGNLIAHLAQHFSLTASFGYDFSEAAVSYARERGLTAKFHTHDIYEKLDRTFDFIFCTEVLEHLLYPGKALSNLVSALNPGGGILLTVPDGRKDTYGGHINFWSPESWQVFVEEGAAEKHVITGNINGINLYAMIFS